MENTVVRYARRYRHLWPVALSFFTVTAFGLPGLWQPPAAPLPSVGSRLTCDLAEVHDGDTVTVHCETGALRIRVWGIDAPEMGQAPWGEGSRQQLQRLLPQRIDLQVEDHDRYGRTVGRLLSGGRDIGLTLVMQGWAAVYERYNDDRRYRLAQGNARQRQRGIWASNGPQQTPWLWRRFNGR